MAVKGRARPYRPPRGTAIFPGMRNPPATLTIAPLLLRAGAFIIDAAILALIGLALTFAVADPDELSDPANTERGVLVLLMVSGALYHIGFLAGMSATPGKLAMGLYVGDKQGLRLRPDTAILRYLIFLAANALLVGTFVSLMLVLIDRQRRALHDRVAGTLVLRRAEGDLPARAE